MDELVLVAQGRMERQCGRNREDGEDARHQPGTVAEHQRGTTDQLDKQGDRKADLRERQAHGLNIADRRSWRWELRQAAQDEDRCDADAAD